MATLFGYSTIGLSVLAVLAVLFVEAVRAVGAVRAEPPGHEPSALQLARCHPYILFLAHLNDAQIRRVGCCHCSGVAILLDA